MQKLISPSLYLKAINVVHNDDPIRLLEYFFHELPTIRDGFFIRHDVHPFKVDWTREEVWMFDPEDLAMEKLIPFHVSEEFRAILNNVVPVIISYIREVKNTVRNQRELTFTLRGLAKQLKEVLDNEKNDEWIKKYPIISEQLQPLYKALGYEPIVNSKPKQTKREGLFLDDWVSPNNRRKLSVLHNYLLRNELIENISEARFCQILLGEVTGKAKWVGSGNKLSYLLKNIKKICRVHSNIFHFAQAYFDYKDGERFDTNSDPKGKSLVLMEKAVKILLD